MENHIIGWHGTTKEAGEKIKSANFNISTGMRQWLGDGVYFFVNGIGDPNDLARQWAYFWHIYKKDDSDPNIELAVLEVPIQLELEEIWDLTNPEVLSKFQKHKEQILKSLIESNNLKGKYGHHHKELDKILKNSDGFVINYIRCGGDIGLAKRGKIRNNVKSFPFRAVKSHLCFKFAFEYDNSISSRLHNCTVLSVWDINCILHTQAQLLVTVIEENNY